MVDVEMDGARVTSYLRHRMPDLVGLHAVEVTKFPRGVSRETWFVTCEWDGGARGLVFRRNLAGGSVCPMDLRKEYDVYTCLAGSQVPVARTLWYEDDPDWLIDGREFYVREQVEGSWEVPDFLDPDPRFDDLRIEVSKEHLRKLALVHTVDWESLGIGEVLERPTGADTAAIDTLDRIERRLQEIQIEPFPLVTECLEWLREHAPADSPGIRLCKGTNGLGEEVFRDGVIVAMSDWELACLGDPANDFAQLQDFLPTVGSRWGLTQGLDYYEELTGIHIDPARIDYYRLVMALQMAMYAHNAAIPLTEGTDYLARLCWVSTEILFGSQFLLAAGTGLLADPC